jgi:hypothetical protein
MKLRIKSSLNPAVFNGNRVVAGTIYEVNGEKWNHPYIAVPNGITIEQIEWVRDLPPVKNELKEWKVESSRAGKVYIVRETPSGKRTCTCDGFHYRRQCRHIKEI